MTYQMHSTPIFECLQTTRFAFGMAIISGSSNSDELQDDLSKLEIWQDKWQTKFNPEKCEVLCISMKRDPLQKIFFLQHRVKAGRVCCMLR